MNALELKVKGGHLIVYNEMRKEDGTYKEFKKKIIADSGRVQMSRNEAANELEKGTEQKADETTEALGRRIQILVSKAYPSLKGSDKVYEEKRFFISNLANMSIARKSGNDI
jgi:hypothetical protein